jgi:hypothetical protein
VLEPLNASIKQDLIELKAQIMADNPIRKRITIEDVNIPSKSLINSHVWNSSNRIAEAAEIQNLKVVSEEIQDLKIVSETNQECDKGTKMDSTKIEVNLVNSLDLKKEKQLLHSQKVNLKKDSINSPKIPSLAKFTMFDFEKAWNCLDMTCAAPVEFLLTIPKDKLPLIFKDSFEPKYLKIIVKCLTEFYKVDSKREQVTIILESLSLIPRFSMVRKFIDQKSKKGIDLLTRSIRVI